MRRVTLDEFRAELIAQGVTSHEHFAFRCPICATIQSGADWMRATDKSFDEIEGRLGFSCIGRATGAGSASSMAPGEGCDWTLGGLFSLHKLEVTTPDGKHHPRFEPATPEEAQAHMRNQPEKQEA